jgi:hypothetical protein
MITIIAAQIFIQAAVLCGILYVVARHEADYSFAKVAMVTAAIGVGSFIIESILWEKLGWFTVIPVLIFTAAMLMTFCWITLWKSVIVIVLFTGFHLLLNIGVAKLQHKMEKTVQESVLVTGPVDKSDYELAKEFHEQVASTLSGERPQTSQPAPSTPTPTEPTEQAPRAEEKKKPDEPKKTDKKTLRDWARQIEPELTPVKKEQEPAAPSTSINWEEAEKKLVIGGKLRGAGGAYFAYVNRKLVEKGNIVSIVYNDTVYRWRVKSISEETVQFQPLDARPTK